MDITFKNVSYVYQANSPFQHQALNNISFHIPTGSFVAIIGHTGSGKSTLIQHLNGLLRPTSGQVTIGPYTMEADEKLKEMKELRSKVGVVFQYPEHQLFDETVEKDIAFGPTNFGMDANVIKQRTLEILPKVGLTEDILERSPLELSGGQMRRVAIAGILVSNPDVYVLDEPTAGLDPRGQKEIMDMFNELHEETNNTTILITHSMEDALAYADYIIILNEGELYMEGTPDEIFANGEKLVDVHLQVPERLQFIRKVNERLDANLSEKDLTTQEMARNIARML